MHLQTSIKKSEQKFRLHYLDGLRGLVSLYIVLVHINRYMGKSPGLGLLLGKVLNRGHIGVSIFIVLSGYCLMIPIARVARSSHNGYMSRGFFDYIKRRARRILPPYYAALFFSILIAGIVLAFERLRIFEWHESPNYGEFYPHFSAADVFSHIFLIHNLSQETLYSINAPMWSVATEWQIYFFFPLLLLPCWRRFGLVSVTAISFLIGIAPLYLLHGLFATSHPWFLGLFTLGMVAADIGFSEKLNLVAIRQSIPWSLLIVIFSLLTFLTEWNKLGLDLWVSDTFCGLTTACLLIYCTKSVIEGKKAPILKVLEHPWTVGLGEFSYSLYLTHAVVITLVGHSLLSVQLTPQKFIGIFYLVAIPLSLFIGFVFYLKFERPFKR
jgi:peptidoglycan/LPS O-acetylase OafA/YrhL